MPADGAPGTLPLRERADASNENNKLVDGDGSWFEGVVLCVSGLMWNDRERAVATVCRGGGAYSGSLHKGCTHLAVLAPEVRDSQSPFSFLFRCGWILFWTRAFFFKQFAVCQCGASIEGTCSTHTQKTHTSDDEVYAHIKSQPFAGSKV